MYASCTDTPNTAPGFSCACPACYTGGGTTAPGSGCYLPAFPGFTGVGKPVLSPPTVNTVKAPEPIKFKFSFGCDTGPDIFAPDFPFVLVNVSCDTFDEFDDAGQPRQVTTQDLVQGHGRGAWTYDTKKFTYDFNFKTDKAWAGLCAVLNLDFNSDDNGNGYHHHRHRSGRVQAFFRFR
jgi:hypothetical protein